MIADAAAGDADILVRAFRGEDVERTPVWLMRQVLQFALSLMQMSQTSQSASGALCSHCCRRYKSSSIIFKRSELIVEM
jgi:Uroporphyrinogen decarboxylase (URO-D)